MEELQKGDPIKVARLTSQVVELRSQLNSATQAKEKVKASMVSLNELIKAANLDLKKALDRSKANTEKALTLGTEKG